METSREWTKLTQNVHGLLTALQIAIGSALTLKNRSSQTRKNRVHAPKVVGIAGLKLVADLERRKNLAFMNNARGQVR